MSSIGFMKTRVERLLGHHRFPLLAALLVAALLLPALGAGLFADDLVQSASFRPELRWSGGIRGDWDIFRFQGPDRSHLRRLMDLGLLPWWTAPDFRLAFFRPLSSLTHAVDYRLFPDHPAIMHAESIALYIGVVVVAAAFYRRLVAPAWAAGLAALFFALDDTHALVVTWIANRNALLAALFGFAALVLHDRARRDGHRPSARLAPALFALALLGGEVAVGTLAYLVAYTIWIDESPWKARARSLAPYAIVTLTWSLAYKGLGYGAAGGSYYIDPTTEPIAFIQATLLRLPMLLLGQLAWPPVVIWMLVPEGKLAAPLAAAVAALALLALVMARVLRGDRRARFFAAGAVLSLVPMCTTWPHDRNLLLSGLGAFGLVALFFARLGELTGGAARAAARVTAGLFVFVHALAAPVLVPVRSHLLAHNHHTLVDGVDRVYPKNKPGGMVIALNAPFVLVNTYLTALRIHRGDPLSRARLLSIAIEGNDGEVERLDERTITVTLRKGFFDSADMASRVFRSPDVPFRVGDTTEVEGMRAEVVEVTSDARPKRVRFSFDRSLDDPSFQWVSWDATGPIPAAPPPVGQKAMIPAISLY